MYLGAGNGQGPTLVVGDALVVEIDLAVAQGNRADARIGAEGVDPAAGGDEGGFIADHAVGGDQGVADGDDDIVDIVIDRAGCIEIGGDQRIAVHIDPNPRSWVY